jgi:hypothetical protein
VRASDVIDEIISWGELRRSLDACGGEWSPRVAARPSEREFLDANSSDDFGAWLRSRDLRVYLTSINLRLSTSRLESMLERT